MDWSPFYCLPKADLTPSGLIQLDSADHEVLLLRRQGVEFRHEGPTPMAPRPRNLAPSERWKNRTDSSMALTITTHRCVLLRNSDTNDRNSQNDARFVHLSNVKKVLATGGPSLMSPNASYKIVLATQTYDDLVLVFRNGGSSNSSNRDDRDQSLKEFQTALERKRWEVATRLEEQTARAKATSNAKLDNRVGLDKILAKNKMRHKQNARLAQDALSGDSENLLQEAAGLLKVIQKYKVMVQKFEGGGNNESVDEEAASKLKGLLSDMGMTSALSQSKVMGKGRNSAGRDERLRDYYELTARQVADFLIPRLRKRSQGGRSKAGSTINNVAANSANSGGMMSLTDVYCLFNRARGSNLISPEDLLASCSLLGASDGITVGLSMRTFPSGVVVLQLDDLALTPTNYEARRALIDLCSSGDNGGKTALEASHVLKLSPLLASEQLEEAERLGWLCRDVTLSTTRFFPNKFVTAF